MDTHIVVTPVFADLKREHISINIGQKPESEPYIAEVLNGLRINDTKWITAYQLVCLGGGFICKLYVILYEIKIIRCNNLSYNGM